MPAGRRSRGKLIHHSLCITPPSAAHRPRRSREITPPFVGKANPPSAAPSSSPFAGKANPPSAVTRPTADCGFLQPAGPRRWVVKPAGYGLAGRPWPYIDQTVTQGIFNIVFECVSPRRAPDTPELPHGFFGGEYKGPGCRGRAEGRGHGHHGPLALASWAPCSTLASVCLFRSGGPVLCMSLCRSWGVSRVPTPPPWQYCYGAGRAFREGGVMSDLCRVCLVFPPLVSLYGLFPVLVSCHYELILFQVCVCDCVNYPVYLSPVCWAPCRLVYLLLPVSLCVYLALSYLDVVIKDYYFEVYPRLRVPRFSLLCARWQYPTH